MKSIAVIPAYNEASRIAQVIRDARSFVDVVIVVDDGSSDNTVAVGEQEGAVVIRHLLNCGAGAATMTGIEAARARNADVIVTLDADGQHDPHDIPLLLAALNDTKVDIAFGNRFGHRNHIPLIRRIFNTIGNIVTWVATGLYVSDSQTGFKALGARAIRDIDLRTSGFEFCTEIVREAAQHRWKIVQVPTKVIYSEYTMAKGQSLANGMRTAFKILLRSFLR